jgi:hypothetical protein
MSRLRESDRVWGIESPEYSAQGSYSTKEKTAAKRLKKYNPVEPQKRSDNEAVKREAAKRCQHNFLLQRFKAEIHR